MLLWFRFKLWKHFVLVWVIFIGWCKSLRINLVDHHLSHWSRSRIQQKLALIRGMLKSILFRFRLIAPGNSETDFQFYGPMNRKIINRNESHLNSKEIWPGKCLCGGMPAWIVCFLCVRPKLAWANSTKCSVSVSVFHVVPNNTVGDSSCCLLSDVFLLPIL